ncbi:peptidase M24 [Nitrosococcus halophilus Nc 4]|uniref:Peptidase M24 n=1 Tax=Nitrosococcus halophilus (strain Nc4) TaxID=472759 RepID=D5C1G7_NITHN|nr:Xaa-Pro peptidase family protein [Nitrosococcus halophilus]ADE16519.1 peptidase M24 [Nitrosococcus halophilus Nc 4]
MRILAEQEIEKRNGQVMRFFSDREFEERVHQVRKKMAERKIDAVIITNPENIYYLTGLNHQGYFAYTSLLLPLDKEPVLIIRAMEKAIIDDMVVPTVKSYLYSDGIAPLPKARHRDEDLTLSAPMEGPEAGGLHPWSMSLGVSIQSDEEELKDYSAPVKATCQALRHLGLTSAHVAFEKSSSFLPYKIAEAFVTKMADVKWSDAEDLVTECRIVQSPAELECTRKAAEISDAMMMSGIAMAGPGVSSRNVMGAIYQTMILRGGTYPAFVPLVRSTRTLSHEHGTWDEWNANILQDEDLLFLEMAGCYWRYHAPIGRLVHIGKISPKAEKAYETCLEALYRAAEALKPGVTADSVYKAWQRRVDRAGLSHYRRHHCGYIVGIGFPPSWSGSGIPKGLREGSNMIIQKGMVFHLMSWLLRTGEGDAFFSDTVVVTDKGGEFLTRTPRELDVR